MAPSITDNVSALPLTNGFHDTPSNGSNSTDHPNETQDGTIDTEFLIVGAGPAGAALACFLGSYGGCRRCSGNHGNKLNFL